MLLSAADRRSLDRGEAVEALLSRVRYLSEREANMLSLRLRPPDPDAREAIVAAWRLAAHNGRADEAAFADRYVRAFLGSARRFPWSERDAVWPTNDVWRRLEDRVVGHALALVAHDLLTRGHFALLYDDALAHDPS